MLEIFFDSRRLNRSLFFLLSIFSWCHKLVKIFLSDKTFQTKLITSERGESAIIRAIYRNKYTSFIKENTQKKFLGEKSHSFAIWYFFIFLLIFHLWWNCADSATSISTKSSNASRHSSLTEAAGEFLNFLSFDAVDDDDDAAVVDDGDDNDDDDGDDDGD